MERTDAVVTEPKIRARVGWWLRRLADRIDHPNAPKYTHWSFTFERGFGVVFNEHGYGCPVAYMDDKDYERAHEEAIRD